MFDVIRKKISIDRSRSHTAGIMPYIPYNTEESDIRYVSMNEKSGNWGGFPLDLAIMNETAEEGFGGLKVKRCRFKSGDEGSRFSTSYNRLRYAEIIKRYYEIQRIINDGIFTRAVTKCTRNSEEKTVCVENGKSCGYEEAEKTMVCDIVLSKNFNKVEMAKDDLLGNGEPMLDMYAFEPVPAEDFIKDGDSVYRLKYRVPNDNGDEPDYVSTYDDDRYVDLQEGNFYVIVNDYDTYLRYEREWTLWWEGNEIDCDSIFPVGQGFHKFSRAVEKYILGKVEVPDEIEGIRVPKYVYYTDIEEYKDWFEKNGMITDSSAASKSEDVIRTFEEMGGLKFYRFLMDLGNRAPWITSVPKVSSAYGLTLVAPYISVPITLEDNHDYGGTYESYLYSYSEKDEEFYEDYSEFSGYGADIMTWYEPEENIYVDSNLSYVIDKEATEVEGITGVWGEFNGAGMFRCTFMAGGKSTGGDRSVENVRFGENSYGHWECNMVSADGILCGDGERIGSGQNKYRTVTILECIRDIILEPSVGSTYYFLAKKDNCESVPFRVPYTENSFHNMMETNDPMIFTGDYVTSISTTDNTWTIQYVIGGTARSTDGGKTFTAIPKTGIVYEEEYIYKPKQAVITSIDGHDNVRVIYDWINIDESKQRVYSEEYRIYRDANLARIVGMEVGSMMRGDSSRMINAKVFTNDVTEMISPESKNTFDITLDRGTAAAFEKHFKLSECNTFNDLKNYGNNFYNL